MTDHNWENAASINHQMYMDERERREAAEARISELEFELGNARLHIRELSSKIRNSETVRRAYEKALNQALERLGDADLNELLDYGLDKLSRSTAAFAENTRELPPEHKKNIDDIFRLGFSNMGLDNSLSANHQEDES